MGRKQGEKVGMVSCHGMGGNQVRTTSLVDAVQLNAADERVGADISKFSLHSGQVTASAFETRDVFTLRVRIFLRICCFELSSLICRFRTSMLSHFSLRFIELDDGC